MIIAYEDRLMRFCFGTLRRMFQAFGTSTEVIDHEVKAPQEEVEDLITIVYHFAGRLYGMRSQI